MKQQHRNRPKQAFDASAGKAFPPAKLTDVGDARALLAAAAGNFTGRGVDASFKPERDLKFAMKDCVAAIPAWQSMERASGKNTPEALEAMLALGELHYLRGKIFMKEYECAAPGSNPLEWFIQSGKAYRQACRFWEKAVKTCACQECFDLPSILKNLNLGHDAASYSFYFASYCLFSGKVSILSMPVELLAMTDGEVGKYGKLSIEHREKSSWCLSMAKSK